MAALANRFTVNSLMTNRLMFLSAATAAFVLLLGAANASVESLRIHWSELRPADQDADMVMMPSAPAPILAKGETLSKTLEGKRIELTGYALPVDREGDLVYEFLLLPMSGLCSHMPPPPPNQAVHVFPAKPYKLAEIYEAVTVSGTLRPELEKTQLIILDGVSIIESGYHIAKADIARADSVPDAPPVRKATPWSFLNKK
jgi:uncharacterized protein